MKVKQDNRSVEELIADSEMLSLLIQVDFRKFAAHPDVYYVYNVLMSKGKKKADYITKAVSYYEANPTSSKVKELFANIKELNIINQEYHIKGKEDLVKLLETVDADYIEKTLPALKEPKKMQLGFSKTDPEAIAVYKSLTSKTPMERVSHVTLAIRKYIDDDMDIKNKRTDALRFLIDIVHTYRSFDSQEDKDVFIDNLTSVSKISSSIKSTIESLNNKTSGEVPLTKEIASLLCTDDDIKSLF